MERKSFLDQEAPEGYVAGLARGAVGFRTSTSPDSFNRGIAIVQNEEEEEEDEDNNNETTTQLNEDGILSTKKRGKEDEDDEEADRIYNEIEKKLQSKKRKSPNNKNDRAKPTVTTTNDNSSTQFSDLKRQLANLTEDDWLNLPEPGDMTRKNKRTRLLEQQQQRMYSAPDTLISTSSSATGTNTTNFKSLSESRDKLLGSQLDNLLPAYVKTNGQSINNSSSVSEELQQSILNMTGVEQDSKYANLQKNRVILSSLRKSEPYKPSSWILSARLEEQDGKNLKLAKQYILEGCKKCPRNDEIWLENIRLNQSDIKLCKQLITNALNYNPKSEKLWLKATDLETNNINKRKVLMKGLEKIPNNDQLWEKLIELENDPNMVKKLLLKAVQLCSQNWEFWSALLNISNYEESKKILNQARKSIKGVKNILKVWITACQLEEREYGEETIDINKLIKLMDKAMKEISIDQMTKDDWYKLACDSERENFKVTTKAIIISYLKFKGLDQSSIFEDVDKFFNDGYIIVAKSILDYIVTNSSNDINKWKKVFSVIKKFNQELPLLFSYYDKAISLNPQVPLFYLMYAKDKWQLSKDIPQARSILNSGELANPTDLSIKFAIIKLELKTGNLLNAEKYIKHIIDTKPMESEKFWYKYIHILRCLNSDITVLKDVIQKALKLFPNCWKLYLQNIQILEDIDELEQARENALVGVKKCPQCIYLWIKLSQIDEKAQIIIRARSILDQAILQNPNNPEIWVYKIQFEKRIGNLSSLQNLTNKALKQFPTDPWLWIINLSLIPKMSQRKTIFLDALKATNNSNLILLIIGVFFWFDGKYSKSKNWFERSLQLDNTNGDIWSWMYNYLKKFGTLKELNSFLIDYESKYDSINKGHFFNKINKDIKNYNKSPKEILDIVAIEVLNYIK